MVAVYSQLRVQAIERKAVLNKAEKSNRFIISVTDEPRRGQILSADGKVLARDEGAYELNIQFRKVPHSDGFFLDLGEATGISGAEFAELAARGDKNQSWNAVITGEQKRKVDSVKYRWRADGLSVKQTGQRAYPLGYAASSLVGAFKDGSATKGLEKSLDGDLTGTKGVAKGLVDRTGAFLPMRMDGATVKRVDGQDVELTIDSDLQKVAADAVKKAVESNKAESGIAIVMDPKTGDILAMSNWPTFDPVTGQGPDGKSADVNPNIMSRFEPGSTMKILTVAKALDEGLIDDHTTVKCAGILKKGPYQVKCDSHHGNRAHGVLDPEKAIAVSCNVSAATWALDIGFDDYHHYIEDLGLMQKCSVKLPYQVSGSMIIEPVAKPLELMCWGFGQSMGVTPLALAAAFTAIGNNGVRMEPRLVKSIGGKEQPVQEGKQVFKAETAQEVLKFMEAVIDSDRGSGKTLRIPGYRLAGKTGTAERLGRHGGGYVANFVGFVPAIQPKAMILVMVDHPQGGKYYGASVAGPVFDELARAVIRKFAIMPSAPPVTSTPKAPAVEVQVKKP